MSYQQPPHDDPLAYGEDYSAARGSGQGGTDRSLLGSAVNMLKSKYDQHKTSSSSQNYGYSSSGSNQQYYGQQSPATGYPTQGQSAYPGGPPTQAPGKKPDLASNILNELGSTFNSIGSDVAGILGTQYRPPFQPSVPQPGTQGYQNYQGSTKNRFDSFSAEKSGNDVKWYVDGCSYFWAVSEALEHAKETIWIQDWWLSPEVYLRRPPSKNEQWRLDRVLQRAAQRGVKVNIIIYKEVPQVLSLASDHSKHALEALSPNIAVFRHPDHLPDPLVAQSQLVSSFQGLNLDAAKLSTMPQESLRGIYGFNNDIILYWAHHEKLCLIDQKIAFMGGLDLCFGRWDTTQHPISDTHPTNVDMVVFPGQDYNNARVLDFVDVAKPFDNKLDRTKSSRMGWSDIAVCLYGPSVDDLRHHFINRWNFIFNEKYVSRHDRRYYIISDRPGQPVGPPSGQQPPASQQTTGQGHLQTPVAGGNFPPPPGSGPYTPPAWQSTSRPHTPNTAATQQATSGGYTQGYSQQQPTTQNFPPPPPGNPPNTMQTFPPPPPGNPPSTMQNFPPPPPGNPPVSSSGTYSQGYDAQQHTGGYQAPISGTNTQTYGSPQPQSGTVDYHTTSSGTNTQAYATQTPVATGGYQSPPPVTNTQGYTTQPPVAAGGYQSPPPVTNTQTYGTQQPHIGTTSYQNEASGWTDPQPHGSSESHSGAVANYQPSYSSNTAELPSNQPSAQPHYEPYRPPPTEGTRGFDEEGPYGSHERGFDNQGYYEGHDRGFGDQGGVRGKFDQYRDQGRMLGQGVEQKMRQFQGKFPGSSSILAPLLGQSRGPMSCQILRSCTKWSNGTPTEHSIQNAYIDVIQNSQHFIYIENQFFITATGENQKPVKNLIGKAIVDRILRAARSGQKYKVIVVIPSVPGFAGDLQDDGSLGTRAIMEFQYNSINRGGHSIMELIAQAGFNPLDYIRFYNLRNYDRLNVNTVMARVEQQSGVTYEVARQQHDDYVGAGYGGAGEGTRAPYPAQGNQYQQYQTAAQSFQSPESGRWDSVSECYMLNGADIRTVPWSGAPEAELDAFVSEELYIHSKCLIADDRVVICGSANLNDRSQLGFHDSELAIFINDPTPVQSTMAGQPWTASRFASSLRRFLFRKHLGLLPPQDMQRPDPNFEPVGPPNVYDWNSPEDNIVKDPLSDTFLSLWNSRARTNTEVYRKAFRVVPDDSIVSWTEYKEFYGYYFQKSAVEPGARPDDRRPARTEYGHVSRDDFPGGVKELKELLSRVRGTLVEMPLCFLQNEDVAKEGISLNIFTEEIYT